MLCVLLVPVVGMLALALTYNVARLLGLRVGPRRECSLMVVLGSGGHTAEMLTLVRSLPRAAAARGHGDGVVAGERRRVGSRGIGASYPRCYVVASTDTLSSGKALRLEAEEAQEEAGDVCVERIPRSREVGQSYTTSVLTSALATLATVPLLLKHAPKVLLTNGPGTCLPLCVVASVLRMLRIARTRVVYVESAARVETLSLTGALVRDLRIADRLLVQWPQLVDPRRKVAYVGRLV